MRLFHEFNFKRDVYQIQYESYNKTEKYLQNVPWTFRQLIYLYILSNIYIHRSPLPIIFAYIANHNLSSLLIGIDIRKYNRLAILTLSKTLPLYLFSIASSPCEFILCNILFQLWCLLSQSKIPSWLLLLLITLSNDVHINPGPCIDKNYLSFMSWNLNSLVKNNF